MLNPLGVSEVLIGGTFWEALLLLCSLLSCSTFNWSIVENETMSLIMSLAFSFTAAKLGRVGHGYGKEELSFTGDSQFQRHLQGMPNSFSTLLYNSCNCVAILFYHLIMGFCFYVTQSFCLYMTDCLFVRGTVYSWLFKMGAWDMKFHLLCGHPISAIILCLRKWSV